MRSDGGPGARGAYRGASGSPRPGGEGGLDADVVVVGAGPAGSMVAGLLAEEGWRVHLLDRARFPRPKPCGECVNPGAVALLRKLGVLDEVLERRPAPLKGWRIETTGGSRAMATFQRGARGLGIARAELDHVLVRRAVERGATLEEGVRASGVEPLRRGARVRVRDQEGTPGTRRGRMVVGADGLRSVVARSLDAYRRSPRIRKLSLTVRLRGKGPDRDRGLLVLGDRRTVGLAPVHETADLWNATVVTRSGSEGRKVAGGDPDAFVLRALRDAGIGWRGTPELMGGPWASGPFDWPVRRCVGPSVLLVGDAAGYFDPLTGQGIRRALRSAVLAARAIDSVLRGDGESGEALAEYDRALRREWAPGRRVQRIVEAVVSRRALRERFVDRLSSAPHAADILVGVTGDVTPARRLLGPRFWLPLLAGG